MKRKIEDCDLIFDTDYETLTVNVQGPGGVEALHVPIDQDAANMEGLITYFTRHSED